MGFEHRSPSYQERRAITDAACNEMPGGESALDRYKDPFIPFAVFYLPEHYAPAETPLPSDAVFFQRIVALPRILHALFLQKKLTTIGYSQLLDRLYMSVDDVPMPRAPNLYQTPEPLPKSGSFISPDVRGRQLQLVQKLPYEI